MVSARVRKGNGGARKNEGAQAGSIQQQHTRNARDDEDEEPGLKREGAGDETLRWTERGVDPNHGRCVLWYVQDGPAGAHLAHLPADPRVRRGPPLRPSARRGRRPVDELAVALRARAYAEKFTFKIYEGEQVKLLAGFAQNVTVN